MGSSDTDSRAALVVVLPSSFLAPFMASALNVALPVIGRELSIGAVGLGWVATAYILAAAVFLLPFGRLADIHGRRKVFLYGLVLYTVGAALSAIAGSGPTLIMARIVNGIGAAMGFATGMAILISVTSAERRGRVLGWNVAAVYLGLSVGPFLGGVITDIVGWRWIFALSALTGAVLAVFTACRLRREWAEDSGEGFDVVGALVYGLTLVALMYGFSVLPSTLGVALVLASLIAAALFVQWELRCPNPVFDLHTFLANRVFAFSNAAALINYAATFATGFMLSLYLQFIKGCTPRHAGLILVAQPVVMTAFSPLAGRLSDRMQPGLLASIGMGLAVVALALFSCLQEDTGTGFVLAGLVVLGFGFALFSSPNTNAVMGSVARKHYGLASGTLGTMRLIGQMLSMGVVMVILALFVGTAKIGPEHHAPLLRSCRTAFTVFTGLCTAGVFASLVRGRTPGVTPGTLAGAPAPALSGPDSTTTMTATDVKEQHHGSTR